jgi:phosphoribosyl 1,2-cyclic phosphodiesterase
MQVKFWGVRGSVPFATDQSMQTGCNTPCVELSDAAADRYLILDAGTGLVGVGAALDAAPLPLAILLSHYHWDHVQGLPFFRPFFQRGRTVRVVGPELRDANPEWLETLFGKPHFPLTLDELASAPYMSFLEGPTFTAGGFEVSALPLTHPGGSMAYRIKGDNGDLVYATDHEFGDARTDAALAGFAAGAAAVIMDAQYTPEELSRMRGRGHASWQECVDFAAAIGAGRLWLFHHQPGRTDREVAAIESAAREVRPSTAAAREGFTFSL